MSHMILFGAGASFGSDDSEYVPAMGGDLFDALAESSRETWGKVSSPEATAFNRDFEQGMRAYTESHASDGTVDQLQCAMAAYFFNFRPEPESLYLKLAKWIRQTSWNGAVASLNYERLLELSLLHSGLTPQVQGLQDSDGEIELVLPHGCCHLFIKNLQVQGPMVVGSMNLKMEGPVVPIHDQSKFNQRIFKDKLPPVMCYFEPGKDARCGLSFINGQKKQFRALVESASVVAIVGVKVRPHDTHIWDPLAETSAKLVYCSGKDAAAEFRTWSRDAGRTNDHAFPTYWKDSFDAICQEVGINVVS